MARAPQSGGVSGHILSWGLPFTEVVTSVVPALVRGDAVVIKASLRAPLCVAAFGHIADTAGFPAGVVNVVQGTGSDVGAELISCRDLSALYVRAGEQTIAQAGRARTDVPVHVVRAGGNVVILGPDAGAHLDEITEAVAMRVRMNSAGGPFGLPLVMAHRSVHEALTRSIVARLRTVVAAPLPTEQVRRHATDRIRSLTHARARLALGGSAIPDDIPHRMGWRLPPTVFALGNFDSRVANLYQSTVPLGPVLGIAIYDDPADLAGWFTAARARDGVALTWGMEPGAQLSLPHALTVAAGTGEGGVTDGLRIPPTWTGAA